MDQKSSKAMLNGALVPSLIVGICSLFIWTFAKGQPGLYGSIIAQGLVLIFFILNISVWYLTKNAKPYLSLLVAWVMYFAKLLILGIFVFLLDKYTNNSQVSRPAFGATAIALTFAWLFGETRAFLKLKLHLPLPKQSA